jgi:hypothetical protein
MDVVLSLLAESGVDPNEAQTIIDFVGRSFFNNLEFLRNFTPVTRRSAKVLKAHGLIVLSALSK